MSALEAMRQALYIVIFLAPFGLAACLLVAVERFAAMERERERRWRIFDEARDRLGGEQAAYAEMAAIYGPTWRDCTRPLTPAAEGL